MAVVRPADAVLSETHGSRFVSYVGPSRGTTQLYAWQLTVPADLRGFAHRPNREEVLLILDGELHVTLDGNGSARHRGDAVLVPVNSELRVDARTIRCNRLGDDDARPGSGHRRRNPHRPALRSVTVVDDPPGRLPTLRRRRCETAGHLALWRRDRHHCR